MPDDKKKKQPDIKDLFVQYKQQYPNEYSKLLSAFESGNSEEVIERLSALKNTFPAQPIGQSDITRFLQSQPVAPDATITTSQFAGKTISSISPETAKLTAPPEPELTPEEEVSRDLNQIFEAQQQRIADEFREKYNILDNINLTYKNIQNTLFNLGADVVEMAGMLGVGVLEKAGIVSQEGANDLFGNIRKASEFIRATKRLELGITSVDELMFQTQFDQQIVNGVTFMGAFVAAGLSGAASATLGRALQLSLAMTDPYQESKQAFDETQNFDLAVNLFAANVPAGLSDYAIDRITIFNKLMTPSIKSFANVLVGMGMAGVTQGGQEALQQLSYNITAKELYDYNREILAGVDDAFKIGGVVGLFFGVGVHATEYMLAHKRSELTPREIALLESQRHQYYDAIKRVAGVEMMDSAIRKTREESLKVQTPLNFLTEKIGGVVHNSEVNERIEQLTKVYQPVEQPKIPEIIKNLKREAIRGIVDIEGKYIPTDLTTQYIEQGRIKLENPESIADKVSGALLYTAGKMFGEGKSFISAISETGERYFGDNEEYIRAAYALGRTVLGAGLLVYTANQILNGQVDNSTLLSLVAPMWALNKKIQPIAEITDNKGNKLGVIDTGNIMTIMDRLNSLPVYRQGIPLPELLSGVQDIFNKIPEVEGVKVVAEYTYSETAIASYSAERKTIAISTNAINKWSSGELMGSLPEELEYIYRLPLPKQTLINLEATAAILHELQHHFDTVYQLGQGANTVTYRYLPSELVNNYMDANKELWEAAISNMKATALREIEHLTEQSSELLETHPNIKDAEIAWDYLNQTFVDNVAIDGRWSYQEFQSSPYFEETMRDAAAILSEFEGDTELDFNIQSTADAFFDGEINLSTFFAVIRAELKDAAEIAYRLPNYKAVLATIEKAENVFKNQEGLHWGKVTAELLETAMSMAMDEYKFGETIGYRLYRDVAGETRARATERTYINRRIGEGNLETILKQYETKGKIEITSDPEDIEHEDSLIQSLRSLLPRLEDIAEQYGLKVLDITNSEQMIFAVIEGETDFYGYELPINNALESFSKELDTVAKTRKVWKVAQHTNEPVSLGQIYKIIQDKYYGAPITEETITQIITDAKGVMTSEKSEGEKAVLITHYYESLDYDEDAPPSTIVLDPEVAWEESHSYSSGSRRIDVPRIFFYPLAVSPKAYSNSLEALIVTPSRTPYHTWIPLDKIYFLTEFENQKVNPLNLPLDNPNDVANAFNLIRDNGYIGVMYKTTSGDINFASFSPIQVYKAPDVRVGITAATTKESAPKYIQEATKKFAEKWRMGEYDEKLANAVVAKATKIVENELGDMGKNLNGVMITRSPAIAIFGDAEPTLYTDVVVDAVKMPDFINAMIEAGKKLKQDAIHIVLEGRKPANVKYGELLPDGSRWQPEVMVVFDEIQHSDISKINQLFTDSGFAGVTIAQEEGIAYIYNLEDNLDDFITNAAKLEKLIAANYPTARAKLQDVKVWAIGQGWGTTASYEEVQSTLLPQSAKQIIQSTAEQVFEEKDNGATPDLTSFIKGDWETRVNRAKRRLDEYWNARPRLASGLVNGEVATDVAVAAVHNAIEKDSDIVTEINNIANQYPFVIPVVKDALNVADRLVRAYDPDVTLKEAKQIHEAINVIINNLADATIEINKDLVVTTNLDKAKEYKRAVYIDTTIPLDVTRDSGFRFYVREVAEEKFGSVAVRRLLNRYEIYGEEQALRMMLRDVSGGNPAYNYDVLAYKYKLLHADQYTAVLNFVRTENGQSITKPLNIHIPLSERVQAQTETPFAVLEILAQMNDIDIKKRLKTDDLMSLNELTYNEQELKNIWKILTEGIVEPDKFLDFTSIMGALLKLGANIIKTGYYTLKPFIQKLTDILGRGISAVGKKLWKMLFPQVVSKDGAKQGLDLSQFYPEYDARRLARGTQEGSTQGFTEDNLNPTIKANLDIILESLTETLGEQKRWRVSKEKAMGGAARLIQDGKLKAEDIDDLKKGTILPAEYVIAYRVIAESNLASSLETLQRLRDTYKTVDAIPKELFAQAVESISRDVFRWAKMRAMISEAGRVVRLATEDFIQYDTLVDVLKLLNADESLVKIAENYKDAMSLDDWAALILYNFALSNPLTHFANILGNSIHLGAEILTDIIAKPTRIPFVFKIMPESFIEAKNEIKRMLMGLEESQNKFMDLKTPVAFDNKAFAKLLLPTTWLSVVDSAYRTYAKNYKMQLLAADLEKGGVHNALEMLRQLVRDPDTVMELYSEEQIEAGLDALRYAEYFSRFITYQLNPETPLGQAFVALSQHWLTRMVVLFARTPMNILKAGFEWSPLGFVNLIKLSLKYKDSGSLFDLYRMRDARKRMVAGTLLFLAFGTAMLEGLLMVTGDEPRDEFERELWQKRGWKPYHIGIRQPDGSYKLWSYRAFEPFTLLFSTMAAIREIALDPKSAEYISDDNVLRRSSFLLMTIFNNLMDASFMTGLNEVFRTQESPQSASEYLERLIVNLFVPNAFAFQRELPDWVREALNLRGKELLISDTFWDRVKAKVGLGLHEDLVPRTDFFGDKLYNKFERFPHKSTIAGRTETVDEKLLDWLERHRLRVPTYSREEVLDKLDIPKSAKERISTEVGKRLKEYVMQIYNDAQEYEAEYEALTQKAVQRYGEENAEKIKVYKTIGQIDYDAKLQRKISRIASNVFKQVLSETLYDTEEYEQLREMLHEEDVVPQLETHKNADRILELEYLINKHLEK